MFNGLNYIELMETILKKASLKYNLSDDEEYYFDSQNRLRVRGFFYDEFTGVCADLEGNLSYKPQLLNGDLYSVRSELQIARPIQKITIAKRSFYLEKSDLVLEDS